MAVVAKLPSSIIQFFVDTGNLNTFKELQRKASQSSTDELVETVSNTLASWIQKTDIQELSQQVVADCRNAEHATAINLEERINLKITVKIFLCSFDSNLLQEAIHKVMVNLGVAYLDSVILAFPATPTKLNLDDMQPLWESLEEFVLKGSVHAIGVSDLDTTQLQELHSWAQVKPGINQVNLESCCVMPPDMTAFAKTNDIQLLTHFDSKVLLSAASACEAIRPAVKEEDLASWQPSWVLRYSIMVKCRGIIQNKGYILSLRRVLPT